MDQRDQFALPSGHANRYAGCARPQSLSRWVREFLFTGRFISQPFPFSVARRQQQNLQECPQKKRNWVSAGQVTCRNSTSSSSTCMSLSKQTRNWRSVLDSLEISGSNPKVYSWARIRPITERSSKLTEHYSEDAVIWSFPLIGQLLGNQHATK